MNGDQSVFIPVVIFVFFPSLCKPHTKSRVQFTIDVLELRECSICFLILTFLIQFTNAGGTRYTLCLINLLQPGLVIYLQALTDWSISVLTEYSMY
jgi:hypothetical protein